MKPSPKSNSKRKPESPFTAWGFAAIGTEWWIGIYEPITPARWRTLKRKVAARIEAFDQTYSRFRSDSLVTAIAEEAGEYPFPADAPDLFGLYLKLYAVSGGQVTPLIGGALADAGYDAAYRLEPKPLEPVPAWEDVMAFSSGVLRTWRPVLLDFGAAGKGYLVDIVAALIESLGVTAYCVDAGGDMRYRHAAEPLRVALEDPDDPSLAVGVAELRGGALCGSSPNRRRWADLHHIFDPLTLRPAGGLKAVWTTAATATEADGLATALFFVPPEELAKHFTFEYVLIRADGAVAVSPGFPGQVFTDGTLKP